MIGSFEPAWSFQGETAFGHERICYLGGPMSGYERSNFDQFEQVERILRRSGWQVYSPRENDIKSGLNVDGTETGKPQSLFLQWDFARISEDAACVIFLPEWRKSPGSNKEYQVARWTGKPVYEIVEIDTLDRYVYLRLVPEDVDLKISEHIDPVLNEMRQFQTGATRNSDAGKLDYEGFLSPLVMKAYAEYLNEHRYLEDGTLRDSDNWQNGIPLDVYMKSGFRHFHDWWWQHRGYPQHDEKYTILKSIMAVIFNASGYAHELLKEELDGSGD